MSVLLETTEGNVTVDLNIEHQPQASYNFIKLCKAGYYFFSPFHSLEKDFIVCGGDPEYPRTRGVSIAGISTDVDANFETEGSYLRAGDILSPTAIGVLSFTTTKSNNNTNLIGSQFTLTLTADEDKLSAIKNQIPFGRVVEGFQTLDAINQLPIDDHTSKRPLKDVRITYVHILHDPFKDPSDLNPKLRSSLLPSKYQLETMRLPQLKASPETLLPENESQFNSIALELVGDLPHFQIKPSPSTLFVARLNPITTSESLTIIFSRFGKVLSGNVVVDPKTGKSLCYGFVEFESQQQAETAYSKMSKGCVIDGREVHVDFSQSVKR